MTITCGMFVELNPSLFPDEFFQNKSMMSFLLMVHVVAFLPEFWMLKVSWPRWVLWMVALIDVFVHLDLVNDFFYSWTPSKTILWEWNTKFDGVRQWLIWAKYPSDWTNSEMQTQLQNASYGTWALLAFIYVVQIIRYLRLTWVLCVCPPVNRVSLPGKDGEEKLPNGTTVTAVLLHSDGPHGMIDDDCLPTPVVVDFIPLADVDRSSQAELFP